MELGENIVVLGDFNMTEMEEDRRGGVVSTIGGSEKEAWLDFKWKHGLKDMSNYNKVDYTWCNNRREDLIQARLDRIYVSKGGGWLVGNHTIHTHLSEVLSDHKPVTLQCNIFNEKRWGGGYYKANVSIIEDLRVRNK
eukprot:c17880_g1_i1 orf=111-524(+)